MMNMEEFNLPKMVATNAAQGPDLRVLCVCTVGALRSQTLAEILIRRGGFNPRSCGTDLENAIVPLSVNLLHFHEVIFCMEFDHLKEIRKLAEKHNIKVVAHVLGIPDEFNRNSPKLISALEARMQELGYW